MKKVLIIASVLFLAACGNPSADVAAPADSAVVATVDTTAACVKADTAKCAVDSLKK